MKRRKHIVEPSYTDIWVPKNSGIGASIGLLSLVLGGAIIWHIVWLALVGLFGIIIVLIIRLTSDDNEKKITAAVVAEHELERSTA
jgi:cytochrome o ubiquinol oxidase subunit 1